MATANVHDGVDRPPGWPACLASLAFHAGLLAALTGVTRNDLVRGPTAGPADHLILRLAEAGPELAGEDLVEPSGELLAAVLPVDVEFSTVPTAADATPDAASPQLLRADLLGGNSASGGSESRNAAGGGRSRPRLGKLVAATRLSVFGAEASGTKFVFAFDHSTSMAGAPLAAAKRELLASLDMLDSVHQFQVIFFNHEMEAADLTGGQQRVPFATEANKALAARFVGGVMAAGGTERRRPLLHALALAPDAVFFLTDADDAMSRYDVDEAVRRAQRSGTAIACIEFGEGPARERVNFLTQLAERTGGQYVYVDAAALRQ